MAATVGKLSARGTPGAVSSAGAGTGPGPTYPDITGFINARNAPYNATGNGSTDDRTAIQNALNAATTPPYGVYLPAGTYMIGNWLVYGNNQKLVGADPATTIIRNLTTRSASDTLMIRPSGHGVTNPVFHSFTLDARSDFFDGPGRHDGSSPIHDLTGTINALVENVHYRNPRTIAVYCDNLASLAATTGMRVQYCHIFGANGGGISVFGRMNNLDYHYNIIENTMDDAIALQDKSDGSFPTNIRVTNNTILNCNQQSTSGVVGTTPRGILAFGADQMTIDHNTVVNTFCTCLFVTQGAARRSTAIAVSNNDVSGAGSLNTGTVTPAKGIWLLNSDNITGSGNVSHANKEENYLVTGSTGVSGSLP